MKNENTEKDTFRMTYSAKQQEELRQIRQKYMLEERPALTNMERVRALDAGVDKKATTWALTIGIIGTLLLGLGMSMLMSDFGALFGTLAYPVGIGIGVVGIAALTSAYPLYVHIGKREREKIASEILRLTDTLLQ